METLKRQEREFSFLYAHPPIRCLQNQQEPVIEKIIKALSLKEAQVLAENTPVIGSCRHTYNLAAKPNGRNNLL